MRTCLLDLVLGNRQAADAVGSFDSNKLSMILKCSNQGRKDSLLLFNPIMVSAYI